MLQSLGVPDSSVEYELFRDESRYIYESKIRYKYGREKDHEFKVQTVNMGEKDDILEFFKDHVNTWYGNDDNLSELKRHFSNSPYFLLQTFIYGFLETGQDAEDFMKVFHKVFAEIIESSGDQGEYTKIYNRCFIEQSRINNKFDVLDLIDRINSSSWTKPLPSNMLTNIYTPHRIPAFQHTKSNDQKYRTTSQYAFTDANETALLSLFRILLYDPGNEIKYSIRTLEKSTEELKNFCKEYFNHKYEKLNNNMLHEEWNEIISGFKYRLDDMKPFTGRNELKPGVINFLYVLATIAGQEEIITTIDAFINNLESNDHILSSNLTESIEKITESVIKQIACNEKVEVKLMDPPIGRVINVIGGVLDIPVDVEISLETEKFKNIIYLSFRQGRNEFKVLEKELYSKEYTNMLVALSNACEDEDSILDKLIHNYIKVKGNEYNKEYSIDSKMIEKIRNGMSEIEIADNFNYLFENYKLCNIEMKEQLIISLVPHLKELCRGTVVPEDQGVVNEDRMVVRVIHNIFASEDMSDINNRVKTIGYLAEFDMECRNFRDIKYNNGRKPKNIANYILFSLKGEWFKNMLNKERLRQIRGCLEKVCIEKAYKMDEIVKDKNFKYFYITRMFCLAVDNNDAELLDLCWLIFRKFNFDAFQFVNNGCFIASEDHYDGFRRMYDMGGFIKKNNTHLLYIKLRNDSILNNPSILFDKLIEYENDLIKREGGIDKYLRTLWEHAHRITQYEQMVCIAKDENYNFKNNSKMWKDRIIDRAICAKRSVGNITNQTLFINFFYHYFGLEGFIKDVGKEIGVDEEIKEKMKEWEKEIKVLTTTERYQLPKDKKKKCHEE